MQEKNNPNVGISDDYAVLSCKNIRFYFGYESTDMDGWCFEAVWDNGNQSIKIPRYYLKVSDSASCEECLLKGIGWFFAKYYPIRKETSKTSDAAKSVDVDKRGS